MTKNFEWFKEKLLIYGADVRNWPKDIRSSGLSAIDSYPEFQKLVQEARHFEAVLKTRKYEEPSSDLTERIISAALSRKKKARHNFGMFLSEIISEFSLSRRAFAVASVSLIFSLIIGFTIGYSSLPGHASTEHYETHLEDFLNYEGDVL